jgi:hypothetical protein
MKLGNSIAAVCTVALLAFTSSAQTRTDLSNAITVDFCELVGHAKDYDQKIVRVRTFYIVGFEASIFNKLDCHDRDVWVEFDPSVETNTNRNVLKRFKRLANAAPVRTQGGGVDWPTRTVEVVAVGHFDGVRRTYKIANITHPQGYGHLGAFDFQFTVFAIENVKVLPRQQYT